MAQPKAGPLSIWKGQGKAWMVQTPSSFLPVEAVVPQERLSRRKGRFPLLLARGPLWMAKSMMAGTPETSSGMFSEFRDYGFTTSITLLSPASEPRPRVLNYFKKAGWGDGLRGNETRNKLSAASLYSA